MSDTEQRIGSLICLKSRPRAALLLGLGNGCKALVSGRKDLNALYYIEHGQNQQHNTDKSLSA